MSSSPNHPRSLYVFVERSFVAKCGSNRRSKEKPKILGDRYDVEVFPLWQSLHEVSSDSLNDCVGEGDKRYQVALGRFKCEA